MKTTNSEQKKDSLLLLVSFLVITALFITSAILLPGENNFFWLISAGLFLFFSGGIFGHLLTLNLLKDKFAEHIPKDKLMPFKGKVILETKVFVIIEDQKVNSIQLHTTSFSEPREFNPQTPISKKDTFEPLLGDSFEELTLV